MKLKYPGLTIDFKSKIGKNTNIVCVDGGKMNIINCTILNGSTVFCDEKGILDIKDSFIGINCVIVAKEKILIYEKCLFAEMVVIRDHNHTIKSGYDKVDLGFESNPIVIHRNVWLGAKSTILKGVIVNEGSSIGANAVVTKSTNPNSVYVGIPAKEIKTS